VIISTPGICGGKPRIAGHRITVQDVVLWKERLGMGPEAIMSEHPGLSAAEISAALAYYDLHQEEIREELQKDEEFVDFFEKSLTSALDRFPRKPDAQDDSNSP
jgi:uncharacterized protein (DUF433 family)